jgi:hypothetical protein
VDKWRNEAMELIIEETPYIPIADAARELKTTHLRILMLIRRNRMKGCQVDGEWYVEKCDIACFNGLESGDAEPGGCRASCASGGCGGRD